MQFEHVQIPNNDFAVKSVRLMTCLILKFFKSISAKTMNFFFKILYKVFFNVDDKNLASKSTLRNTTIL